MPTSAFSFTKPSVSQPQNSDLSRLRRLASASNITKAFSRRPSVNDENIPAVQAQLQPKRDIHLQPAPRMPAPLQSGRYRRASSPHPRKELLPRSVTISNLPLPTKRLPTTHSSISLLSRAPTPSPSLAAVTKKTAEAGPVRADRRRSMIPTPTSRRLSDQGINAIVGARGDEVERTLETNKAKIARTPDVVPASHDKAQTRAVTPEKLQHLKGPERKGPQHEGVASKRLLSAYDVVHHGLLKAISPPAMPPPQISNTEGKCMSVVGADHYSATESCQNENTQPLKRLSYLKSSLRGGEIQQDSQSFSCRQSSFGDEPEILDGFVRKAECSAYWTGRFMSLNDKYSMISDDTPKPSVKGGAQIMQNREEQRAKRIFDVLEAKCLNAEAKKSLWQFRIQMASIRSMPSLLTTHVNDHINGIGGTGRVSLSSTDHHSERGSLEGLGMPQKDCLPKGPERVDARPSWATPSTFGSYGSYKSSYPLIPQPLIIPKKTEQSSTGQERYLSPTSPVSAVSGISGTASIASIMSGHLDDKDKRRISFVGKLIGKSKRDASISTSTSHAVYEGT